MNAFRRITILSLILTAWGCTSGRSSNPGIEVKNPITADEADLRQTLANFTEALNTCDFEKTMDLFLPEATMFFPLPETPLRAENKDEIAAVFKDFYAQVKSGKSGPRCMNIKPGNIRIQHIGQAAAVSFQIVSGPVTSRRSIILQKRDGHWLILHFHASNIRQEAEE
jgi:hypothetical protein